jgi:3-hydroxyacyl-CoA dehydrogenase/enoyl-CoA hydratase/3-hydroxybutyryl-CoA epimerase
MKAIEYFEDENHIAWLLIDLPGSEVNLVNDAFIDALEEVFSRVEVELRLRGVVFMSRKRDSFVSGADLDELAAVKDSEEARARSKRAQKVMNRIAALDIPTVAAIHGPCLGMGLELAVACRRRVASNWRGTRLGLPELRHGRIPSAGGTQRLPRLIGVANSLDLILKGHDIGAEEAFSIGLLNNVGPREILEREARHQVLTFRKGARKPRLAASELTRMAGLARGRVFDAARRRWAWQRCGYHPLPYRVIEVVEEGLTHGIAAGLELEAKTAGDLSVNTASVNLLGLERRRRRRSSEAIRPSGDRFAEEIGSVGIFGGGRMGTELAFRLTDRGIRTRLRETSPEKNSAALKELAALHLTRTADKMGEDGSLERRMDRITVTTGFSGFRRAGLIIEAVPEEAAIKREAIREIEEIVPSTCILATTSRSLSVSALAADMAVPDRLVGLHFYRNGDGPSVTEVVCGDRTGSRAIRTAESLVKAIGTLPIVVRGIPGSLVNRILFTVLNESFYLLELGLPLESIDEAMVDFGFTAGPFRLVDDIGFHVISSVASSMSEKYGQRLPLARSVKTLLASVQRNGDFRFYNRVAGDSTVDPRVYLEIGRTAERGMEIGALTIQDRLLYAMINETAYVLEEGVVGSAGEIELAMVHGMGFPAYRGGLLRLADDRGIETVTRTLLELSAECGPRFHPAPLLEEMCSRGTSFLDD